MVLRHKLEWTAMILAMTPFTLFHVLLSFVGIGAGFVVVAALLHGERREGWTQVFLITTAATTITGFLFPITIVTPALVFGVISSVVLAAAIAARYVYRMKGRWRSTYIIAALAALYLNVFVLVVQAFQKIPALNALAPTGTEPSFAVVQGLVLVFFVTVGFRALRRPPMAPA